MSVHFIGGRNKLLFINLLLQFFCSCTIFCAFMIRLSCVHVQTFLRSPDFRAFMSRLSCVHVQTFLQSPDFRAFMSRLSRVHVRIFVRSCSDFRAFMSSFRAFMSRLSCVHQTFVRSCSDFRAFMSRLSCVRQTFVRSCSDFRVFFGVSRLCNFERTTPPSCVHLRSGHTCFRLGSPQPGSDFATLIVNTSWVHAKAKEAIRR